MLLRRENIKQKKWPLFVFFVFLLGGAFAIAFIINYSELGNPVYEPWFGSSFQWPHLFAGGLVALIIFLGSRSTISPFLHPSHFFMREERNLFKRHYFMSDTKEGYGSAAAIFYIYLMASFLAALLVSWFAREYEVLRFVVMIVVFLGIASRGVVKAVKSSSKTGQDFLDKVNTHLKNTHLNLKNNVSMLVFSVMAGLNIEGTFKGRPVEVHGVSGAAKIAQGTKFNYSIRVTFPIRSDLEIQIEEKKPGWRHLKTDDLNSYLKERFNIKGAALNDLPSSFKNKISDFSRNLYLEVKKGELIYHSKDISLMPFYTLEGLVLFLDELTAMADALEK